MENKIQEAKKLLRRNGYAVIKLTEQMKKDIEECDSLEGDKDCSCCSCSICVIQ